MLLQTWEELSSMCTSWSVENICCLRHQRFRLWDASYKVWSLISEFSGRPDSPPVVPRFLLSCSRCLCSLYCSTVQHFVQQKANSRVIASIWGWTRGNDGSESLWLLVRQMSGCMGLNMLCGNLLFPRILICARVSWNWGEKLCCSLCWKAPSLTSVS